MNLYNFSGGIVNQKSPYLMKTDEVLHLRNFDIEGGGMTVRPGTKKLYGPYSKPVTSMSKALSTKGHEILFIQTGDSVQMVIEGMQCNGELTCSSFQVLPVTDGFSYIINGTVRQMLPVYRRCDPPVTMGYLWDCVLLLEPLADDCSTQGEFPADLFDHSIWDEKTNSLYYAVSHTSATKENIDSLLQTNAFVKIGNLGDMIHIRYEGRDKNVFNPRAGYCDSTFFLTQAIELFKYTILRCRVQSCRWLI